MTAAPGRTVKLADQPHAVTTNAAVRGAKSAADRVIGYLSPSLALQQRKRFRKETLLIMDGTLVGQRNRPVRQTLSAAPRSSPTAATRAPAWSSRTAASGTRPDMLGVARLHNLTTSKTIREPTRRLGSSLTLYSSTISA